MSRRDDLYLVEIVESCRHIRSFLVGVDIDAWAGSELVRSAVLQKLMIVGEAASRVSASQARQYSNQHEGRRGRAGAAGAVGAGTRCEPR
jgi:uncharacterized protein with HEPN domain